MTFAVSMQAAFTIIESANFTARVSVTGNTNYGFFAQIYRTETAAIEPLNMIWWTNVTTAFGSSANPWKVSMDFIKVSYSNGGNNWGLAVSTWNTNGAAAFNAGYKQTIPVVNSGLIQSNNPANPALTMVWQIQDSTSYTPGVGVLGQPTPLINPPQAGAFTNTYWSWKYFLDQSQTAWTNRSVNSNVGTSSINYYAVANYDNNRLFGSGPGANQRAVTASPNYIFTAADFFGCSPAIYKTSAVMLQMYHP